MFLLGSSSLELQGQAVSRTGDKEHGVPGVTRSRFYAQTWLLSSRHEAGELAVHGARIGQDRRFRPGERDPFETSVHGLRVDQMVIILTFLKKTLG